MYTRSKYIRSGSRTLMHLFYHLPITWYETSYTYVYKNLLGPSFRYRWAIDSVLSIFFLSNSDVYISKPLRIAGERRMFEYTSCHVFLRYLIFYYRFRVPSRKFCLMFSGSGFADVYG